MSRLGGAFPDTPLIIQQECKRVTDGALVLVGANFKEAKPPPQLSHHTGDSNDYITTLRADTESLKQQRIQAQLELETFRRAILMKQSELERVKKIQFEAIQGVDESIASNSSRTNLPLDVVMRIFRFVRDYGIAPEDRQNIPLYRIADGFSEFPGWQRALLRLIPIVLVHTSPTFRDSFPKMSQRLQSHLTYNPRLFELDKEESLAGIDADESVVVLLKDSHPRFKEHLEISKRFKWHTVVLLATSTQAMRDALAECGERLWRIRVLEVRMIRQRRNDQGWGLILDVGDDWRDRDDWSRLASFDLPPMPHELAEPTLRGVTFPLGAIPRYAPLMSRLEFAKITIPNSASDIGSILRALQGLPKSLTRLSLRHEKAGSSEALKEEIDCLAHFPNLVELCLDTFDPRAMNALLRGFDCPSLRILRAFPSSVIITGTSDNIAIAETLDDAQDAEIQAQFVEILHERFPGLTGLVCLPSDFTCRPLLERLMKRNDITDGTNVSPKSAYLLPRLDFLHPKDPDVDDIALLISFASLRLRERSVSDIRVIRLSRSPMLRFTVGAGTGTFWYDRHVDALRLLAPDTFTPV